VRAGKDGIRFSAEDLRDFLACEHVTWLEGQVARGEAERPSGAPDPMSQLLFKRGRQHEADYLAGLEQRGVVVARIPYQSSRPLAAVEATHASMRAGEAVIYQGVLQHGEWFGIVDFLERVERPSGLGAWGYEVADTKLGSHVKPEYLLQLALYSDLLADAQGEAPERMHVVLAHPTRRESFLVREFASYVRALRSRLVASVALPFAEAPYPMPVDHCEVCDWAKACAERRRADDHLSGVANILRKQIARLEAGDVGTMAALAALPAGRRVDRIAAGTLATLAQQARLQVQQRTTGEPCYDLLPPEAGRGFALLPAPSPKDVFFDLEGDPYVPGGLEYLFGAEFANETGEWVYHAWWGHDPAEEKRSFEQFIDFVTLRRRDDPSLHVYHYAHYEPTALKRLAGRYGTRENELDELLRGEVFVDLYRVLRQGLRTSFPGYSLKDIEPFFMGPREAAVLTAGGSIVAYEQWLESREDAQLQEIAHYNMEDCRSTRLLRDWLLERARESKAQYGDPPPAPELVPPDDEKGREERERDEAERAELSFRLTAGLPGGDPAALQGDARLRWLLAQLLEYHQREARPVWWSFFDRMKMLPEQLVDDSESIGGLEPVTEIPAYKRARSLVHTLRFPAQDFRLKPGSEVLDPATGKSAGEILALDEATGQLELRRGPGLADVPLPAALLPGGPYNTKVQRAALRRLARAIASNDKKRYRALRDLLAGSAPRVTGFRAGAPLQGKHLDLDAAWPIVSGLDQSALFIQGPPGAGKTWLGARLIVRLMREGKKVGVTAISHRAIHNLLDEIEKVADEEGFVFKGLKKCSGGEDDDSVFQSRLESPRIDCITENPERWPEGVSLLAGTSWLFSRLELDGAADDLFIDEAGQVSLADALAVGTSARNLVLLGDPQQLPQVSQGTHPKGAEASVLQHLLGEHDTIPPERGLFLEQTWRMHPDVTSFISELAYEQRLVSAPGRDRQRIDSAGLSGTGLIYLPVEHTANGRRSLQEVDVIAREIGPLLAGTFTDHEGKTRPLTLADILVVAPYNAQVDLLRSHLPKGTQVGTVDKFQGREAAVVFFSMATSSGDDLPRDLSFLFSRNRLNVAVSRARALAVLVASPKLLQVRCKVPAEMRMVNGVARFVELQAQEKPQAIPDRD
jgi:uncharacterized protein